MRDYNRIKRICQLLEKTWPYYPDLRLGQLLLNFVFGSPNRDSHIYFREDNEVETCLKRLNQKFNMNHKKGEI